MKKSKLVLYSLLIVLFGFGCGKDSDEDCSCPNTGMDEYYIKYDLRSTTIYLGGTLNVIIKDETGISTNYTVDTQTEWELTVGPVSRGFDSSIHVIANQDTNDRLRLYTKISVSKNNSPFAIKASDESDDPRDDVYLTYTIDY